MTLVETLERNTRCSPDKVAIIYKDEKLKYIELNNIVNRVANCMTAMGIKQGDKVGLMLPRIPQLIIAFLASVKLGAIPAPINYNLSRKDIGAFVSSLKPTIIFVDKIFINLLEGLIPEDLVAIVVNGEDGNRHTGWDTLLNAPADNPAKTVHLDDVAYLNYTSGSTGNPAGAITTHSNIYWNTVAAVEVMNITSEDVHLCMFASFAHPHELFARALYTGGTMVLLNEVYPKSLIRTIRDNGVTCMVGLPPMYELLLDVAKDQDLGCLRIPESGGMYTKPDLIERFEKTFGVPIYPVWGSTETTGIAIANKMGDKRKYPSIGKPCPYYEVKVVDEAGLEVRTGQVGELIFKGPAIVKGYYEMDEKTNSCFKDGWYYSGDLGRMDEEGFFYFIERKSLMMKVAGLKVYPLEVEQIVLTHPKVKDVAVIRSIDGLKGEKPKAIIVPKDGQKIKKKELQQFCKGKLANYKIPRIVEFRHELPKTGSGKIDKKVLMEEYKTEVKK